MSPFFQAYKMNTSPIRHQILRFRRFIHKSYAAFNSLHKSVSIGKLSAGLCDLALKKNSSAGLLAVLLTSLLSFGLQASDTEDPALALDLDSVRITATPPLSFPAHQRAVYSIGHLQTTHFPAQHFNEVLDALPGLDLRQRGQQGVQADLSMRGGSFDQVLVLLNGINITDPQTGHYNLAVDHNLLLMDIMNKVAPKHHFKVLLHEKPFDGVNGSGKHCNWSLSTNSGLNVFSPGKTAEGKLMFIAFLVNTLMAVHKHNALLKASVASAGNAHRLGLNEAPPAIVSVFLGSQLSGILDKLEESTAEEAIQMDPRGVLRLNVGQIPELMLDNTDRNRTSPFAFTGNRFEFRALGSSANCASAMIVLNTAVAGQLMDFNATLNTRMAAGESKEKAIFSILREYILASKSIRFDGNGYCDEWKAEAALRGLDCENSVPLQYDAYLHPSTIALFEQTEVLNSKELQARNEVKWETYTKKIQIEARVLGDLALNHINPVAIRYQSSLLDNLFKLKSLFPLSEYEKLAQAKLQTIKTIEHYTDEIQQLVESMVNARKVANKIEDEREKAIAYHDSVEPFLGKIRSYIDKLELMVDNELWPLPKYRELLFIK